LGETKDDIEETIRYAHKLRKLGADSFIFSIAAPVHGTELYNQAKKLGFLRKDSARIPSLQLSLQLPHQSFRLKNYRSCACALNLVNPTFTREKVLRALQNPKKTIKVLLKKQ